MDALLRAELDKNYKTLASFKEKLSKSKYYLFKYFYPSLVLSDNNGS